MSTIAAGTTSGTALVSTGNTDGTLQLQVNGTTPSITLAANGSIGVGSTPGYGTNGQVLTSAGTGAAPTWTTVSAGLTLGTPVATTSGTSITFTGIPAGVKQINIMFNGVSIDSTNDSAIIQLGDSGGIETSGYGGAYNRPPGGVSTQFSNGFIVFDSVNTAFTYNGLLILTLQNSSTNTFTGMSTLGMSNAAQSGYGGGVKSLSAVLTQIRLTTINGASSFDAGEINISYF